MPGIKREPVITELVNDICKLNKMAKKYISSKEYEALRAKYHRDGICVSSKTHKTVTTSAINLFKMVLMNGGTPDEIKNAIKHMYLCLDCEKYLLDYKQFRKDYGILELSNKYNDRKLV